MLRDIAVARVKMILGFRTDQDANIVQAMQEVQEELEKEPSLPTFLKKIYVAPFQTSIGVRTVDAPADFIREDEDDQLFIDSLDTILVKDQMGELRLRYPDSGPPVKYALVDRKFYFFPLPDAVYALTGTYFAEDAVLTTNIENKWLANVPDLIIGMAGMIMAASLRDQAALQLFTGLAASAKTKIAYTSTANEAAGSKPVIGGDN